MLLDTDGAPAADETHPIPCQLLPARTFYRSERKLKISHKSMGEELPRNVSLCNRLSLPRWGREKEGLWAGARAGARPGDAVPSLGWLSLPAACGPSPAALTWPPLCSQSLSSASLSPRPPLSAHHVPASQSLSLLCSEPCQGFHFTQKKSLESLLSRTEGPSMISALSPTAHPPAPTLLWPHSTPHCCSNTWHEPTPGPLHMLFPLPGILYPHTLPKSPNLAPSYHPAFSSVISSPARPSWPE